MPTTTTDDTDELIRRVIDAFDARNYDELAALHDPDAVLHENGATYSGYDTIEEHMAGLLGGTGATFDVADVLAGDDAVACRYTITGEGLGEDGELTALSFARVEDGRIAEVWVHSR